MAVADGCFVAVSGLSPFLLFSGSTWIVPAPGQTRLGEQTPGQAGVSCCVPLAGSATLGSPGRGQLTYREPSSESTRQPHRFCPPNLSTSSQGLVSLWEFTLLAALWVRMSARISELEVCLFIGFLAISGSFSEKVLWPWPLFNWVVPLSNVELWDLHFFNYIMFLSVKNNSLNYQKG